VVMVMMVVVVVIMWVVEMVVLVVVLAVLRVMMVVVMLQDYCTRLSAAIILSTILAIPMIFLCVVGIQIMTTSDVRLMEESFYYLCILSTAGAAWVVVVFVTDRNYWQWKRYSSILLLTLLSFFRSLIGITCYPLPESSPSQQLLSIFMLFTTLGLYVVATIAALSLTPLVRCMRMMYLLGGGVVMVGTVASAIILYHDSPLVPRRNGCILVKNDVVDVLVAAITLTCIITTLLGLYFKQQEGQQYYHHHHYHVAPVWGLPPKESDTATTTTTTTTTSSSPGLSVTSALLSSSKVRISDSYTFRDQNTTTTTTATRPSSSQGPSKRLLMVIKYR